MKRCYWVALLAVSVLLLGSPIVQAAGPQELVSAATGTFETTIVSTNTGSVGNFSPGDIIYGFKLLADDAADVCGLYDVAAVGGAAVTQGVFIDELSQETDNKQVESDWPAPYRLVTDLTVITNGFCVIFHDVK